MRRILLTLPLLLLLLINSCNAVEAVLGDSTSRAYPAYESTTLSGLKIYSKTPMNTVPIALWDYELEWSTRSVLAKSVTRTGDGNTGYVYKAAGFWEVDGKNWVWRKQPLVLDEKIFGHITVTKAPEYEIK